MRLSLSDLFDLVPVDVRERIVASGSVLGHQPFMRELGFSRHAVRYIFKRLDVKLCGRSLNARRSVKFGSALDVE